MSTRKAKSGCSNQGKYPNVPAELFCGPAGGACPGTYPVNTPGRAIAAMSYARHAPNPEGIRACARKVAKAKGWTNPQTGKIRRTGRGGKSKTVYIQGERYAVKKQNNGDVDVFRS